MTSTEPKVAAAASEIGDEKSLAVAVEATVMGSFCELSAGAMACVFGVQPLSGAMACVFGMQPSLEAKEISGAAVPASVADE